MLWVSRHHSERGGSEAPPPPEIKCLLSLGAGRGGGGVCPRNSEDAHPLYPEPAAGLSWGSEGHDGLMVGSAANWGLAALGALLWAAWGTHSTWRHWPAWDRIIDSTNLAERFWESLPKRVKAP